MSNLILYKNYYKYADSLVGLLKFGLSITDLHKLIDNGIFTLSSLSKISKKDLYHIKGFNDTKIEKIKLLTKKVVFSGFITAKNFLKSRKKLYYITTLNEKLDLYLRGGFESSTITEIYGENKSGKSQLCHILCVSALKNYINTNSPKKVIYIDTEGSFRPERLIEISSSTGIHIEKLLKNIFFAKAFNTDQQNQLLTAAASISAYSNVIMLVIDSATYLFRTEYTGRGELFLRQSSLGKFLKNLQRFSEEFNVSTIITNQVVSSNLDGSVFCGQSLVKPIGGNIMGHFTNTRIWLKKSSSGLRVLKVVSSPRIPDLEIKFRISSNGLIDINLV